MDLSKVKTNELLKEFESRFDHIIIYMIKDEEGGIHLRRWRGNYLACLAMCGVLYSYILDAYKATMKLVSKEKSK